MTRTLQITLAFAFSLATFLSAQAHAEGLLFVHTDHLGTPAVMTDMNQNVVWERQQTPFGETVSQTDTTIQPQRFPGQYEDPETGYYYNYFRDYDPSIGRYVQSDPIGLQGGLNTYGYVYQNPVNYIDPTGEAGVAAAEVIVFTGGALVLGCALTGTCQQFGQAVYDACQTIGEKAPEFFLGPLWQEASDKDVTDDAIGDLIDGLSNETDSRGRPKRGQYDKPDGDVQGDFDSLPGVVGDNGQKILPDGSTAGIHGSHTTGRPTLHIHRPKGSGNIKIRY